ncbi:MAG: hypothetical protein JKY65_11170 [Planctomycetes bacterium]|nr:hypothetical protein [Planctomycetota bacterium]
MSRILSRAPLAGALLALALGVPALAQDPNKDPGPYKDPDQTKPFKHGLKPFKRDQGTSADLAKHVKGILAALGKRYPNWPYDPAKGAPAPKVKTPPKAGGGGLKPPTPKGPKRPAPTTRTAEEIAKDTLLQTLRGWTPSKEALVDVLTNEGILSIGKKIYKQGKRTFEHDEPRAIADALGLHPSLTEVKVFTASTEDLLTMELETVSASEFASGLRDLARHLKPRYRFYVVVLNRTEVEKKKRPAPAGSLDSADLRLQLFALSGGKWIYVGRIWRLDQDAAAAAKKAPSK